MRDGRTRRVTTNASNDDFLACNEATLTALNGPAAGSEYPLDAARVRLGRSPNACIQLDDASVSLEHVAFELGPDGFGIRDLDSTNGLRVNGAKVDSVDLKHGDRIDIGNCELQYVVSPRNRERVWNVEG